MTPGVVVVVVVWYGFITDNNTTLGLCQVALGCGNNNNKMNKILYTYGVQHLCISSSPTFVRFSKQISEKSNFCVNQQIQVSHYLKIMANYHNFQKGRIYFENIFFRKYFT